MVFCERATENYLANKSSVEFNVSPDAEQSWVRLARGGGSPVDVEKVFHALREQWSVSPSDPRALKLWLLDHGINLDRLPTEEVSNERTNFRKYSDAKRRAALDLINGVLSGPNVAQFFSGLRSCPTKLKEIAFREALSACKDERLLVVLSVLSLESRDLIRSCLSDAPESSVLKS